MATKDSEFTKTEIKAGFVVLTSVAVFLAFFAAISGWRPAVPVKKYYVLFNNTIGLHAGSLVRFGGKEVGRVESLDLDSSDQSRIRVNIEVLAETPVNEKSQAYITQVTLTTENHVEISTGEKDAPLLAEGSEIPATVGGLFGAMAGVATELNMALQDVRTLIGAPAGPEAGAEPSEADVEEVVTVADVLRTVDSTIGNADEIVLDLQTIVNDRNADLEAILAKVLEVEGDVQNILSDVDDLLADNRANIDKTVANVSDVSGRASEISAKLAERFDTLANALQATLENAKQASGDAKGLLDDNRPQIEDMILDLRDMVRYLKQFSRTISEQPQSVIRGPQEQGRRAN